jgi:hypothetical protein
MYKSPGIGQIMAKLIQAGGETLYIENHKVISSVWNKEELTWQWKEFVIVHVHKKEDKTYCSSH